MWRAREDEAGQPDAPSPPSCPHWDDRPLALADLTAATPRLKAVSRVAGRRRVRAGMTVTEATAHCAELGVRTWDDVVIHQAIIDMTGALLAASPQVTPVIGSPGLWWVGASGFDAVGGERGLLDAIARIIKPWHPDARAAIADSCVAARVAVWGPEPFSRVPPGSDAAYLSTAPLALVPMDDEVREALLALGLRTLGALAALSSADVERRWGEAGLAAWRLARGDDRRRPGLTRVEARRAVSAELPMSVSTLEPVLFLVRAALDRLVTQLVSEGRAAATIALTLALDPRGSCTREVRMARPLARARPLFERCRTLLERFTLSAPVTGVTVAITATAPLSGEQGNLFDTAWRDPAAVDAALDRLRTELGPDTVVRPVARDQHCPERSGAWVEHSTVEHSTVEHSTVEHSTAEQSTSDRPVRQARVPTNRFARRFLESPEPIAVECTGDRPVALHWHTRRIPIERAIGPERLAGDWWDDAYCRDYWRCESATTVYVVYVDYTRGARWYVQGWQD